MLLEGLYGITDEKLTPDECVLECVTTALKAGVSIIQYRNKTKTDNEVKDICIALQSLCSGYDALFIIDDRAHLAQEIGADGLHIGQNDISLKDARAIFKDGIIGVSCYGDVENALKAQKEGANYVAFGSFFPSPTKPHSAVVSLEVITKAKEVLDIPVCVIGGISCANIDQIMQHKPEMVSVINALFDGNITINATNLLKKMNR